ncbi:MAG: type II toxin-antitoxin system prevent-host-death family antitoxin [Anaerolineae bacterium]
MTVKTLDSNQARNHWREMLDMALTADDIDVIITRYNKPVVAVVAYEDYLAVQDELTKRRAERRARRLAKAETLATMFASERALAREWNTPEEDEAWADL